jgi:hypothetical protein
LSTFSSIENGRYSEIAENLAPSIKAYFQIVAGTGGNHPSISVVKHDAEKHASALNALDVVVASKLEYGDRVGLIKYIDGPVDFHDILGIVDNIEHFVNIMRYRRSTFTPDDLKELKKLLAQENFLEGHHVQQLRHPLSALLFSMFQGRNPEFSTISETFLKQKLDNPTIEMDYENFSYMRLIVELSTDIFYQPAYCQKMDKAMMGVFDDRLFYNALINPILVEADEKIKSREQYTNLKQFHFASIVKTTMKRLPVIQIELVKELVSKINDAAIDSLFSVESKSQILKNMDLIDNPQFQKRDGNFTSADLLNLDGLEDTSQLQGHHWRMMRLFALIRSKNNVMDASDLSKPFYSKDLEIKFNEFYGDLYQECIGCMFPAVDQSVFLVLWEKAIHLNQKGHNMSYEFLREMYDQNKSIFWIPILGLVIQEKEIPQAYWDIAQKIRISNVDAASYLDFLCRWVYPLSYNSHQRSKLLAFSRVLSEKFAGFSKKSYYLKNRLLVDDM